jgi:outer membrane protein
MRNVIMTIRFCGGVLLLASALLLPGRAAAQSVPLTPEQAGRAAAPSAPLTLEQAVRTALDRSRDLREAELELGAARGRVREAWGNVYPQVSLNTTYTRNLTVPGTFMPRVFFDPDAGPDEQVLVRFGTDNMWNFSVRADQPLFRASAFIGVGAAERYEALQREALRGRAQSVVTRVQLAFYAVMLAQESVRLTENAVTRIRQTLDETRAMERAGVASSYDVLRLEVELANVEPALRRARNAALAARRGLAVEIGLADLESVAVAGDLLAIELDSMPVPVAANGDDTGELIAQAIEQRTELRQLRVMESLRRAELRAEQSEYLPQVTLFGTYSVAAQQSGTPAFFGGADGQRSYGRQVGVMVTMPLFSGMQRPARVAQRQAVIRQVQTQQDLLRDQVQHQVMTYLDQVEEARQRAAAQRFGVRQAQRGFQIASVQYREGISSALELTDAESALRLSEFNYAEAVYDYLVASARLDEALGAVDIDGHADRHMARRGDG